MSVPLSEDEQRILQEIEEQFYASDPAFARGVSSIYRPAARNLKWAAVGFVLGVVLLIATLATSVVLAFGGFLVMLASAFWFERNLRRLGRAGWNQVAGSFRAAGLRDRMGDAGKKMRDRLRRDES